MRKRKNSNFVRLLALAINFQMIYSPLAYSDMGSIVNSVSQIANTAANTVVQMNMQNNAQMQQQIQGLGSYRAQQIPPNLVAPPAFASCPVFMAETNLPVVGQRCEAESFDMNMLPYYSSLLDVATSNVETYSAYTIKGNATTSPGMRCLEDAETKFKALLDSRAAEVDKLIEKLTSDLMIFNKQNEPLLNQIKLGNALLFGKPEDLLKDVRFEDKFNDAQCTTILSADQYKTSGQQGGYKAITDSLSKLAFGEANKDSAKSFSAKAGNLEQDIISLANQAASRANGIDPMLLSEGGGDLISKSMKSLNNLQNTKSFKNALDRSMNNLNEKAQNVQSQVVRFLDSDEANLFTKDLMNPNVSTASIVQNYRNQSEAKCIEQVIQNATGGDVGKFASNLVTQRDGLNISNQMRRESDNRLKNDLPNILNRKDLSLQQKMDLISSGTYSSNLNSTKFVTTQSTSFYGVNIKPGEVKIGDLFKVFQVACNQYANARTENSVESPNNIIKNIEKAHSELSRAHKTFATNLKAEIQDELLSCSQDTTTGTAASSCSGDIYNTSGDSFCLRTARQCANNTLACADKAQKIYDTTRQQQTGLAQNYNTQVEGIKTSLMSQYMGIKNVLEQKARELDVMFPGQVYAYQQGQGNLKTEDLDLTVESMLLQDGDLDSALRIQDPKAYVDRMQENLANIKQNIEQQNAKIKDNLKNEKDNIIANAKLQKDLWTNIQVTCNQRINQFNQTQTEMANKQNEAQQKAFEQTTAFCRQATTMSKCPTKGEVDSLVKSMEGVSAQNGDYAAVQKLREISSTCESFNDDSGNYHDVTNQSKNVTVDQYCANKSDSLCSALKGGQCVTKKVSTECSDRDSKDYTTCSQSVKDSNEECTKEKEAKQEAETKLASLVQAQNKANYVSSIGQQSFPSCNATASGDFGKTAADAISNIANTAAGAAANRK